MINVVLIELTWIGKLYLSLYVDSFENPEMRQYFMLVIEHSSYRGYEFCIGKELL